MDENNVFKEIQSLVDQNADLLFHMREYRKMLSEMEDLEGQTDDTFPDREHFKRICTEATQTLDSQKVHILSAYAQHLYSMAYEVSGLAHVRAHLYCSAEQCIDKVEINSTHIQELLNDWNYD